MKNKILVTGASGFLGSNLVRELCKNKNNEVQIFILKGTWHPFLDNLKIKIFYGDVRNKDEVINAMKGCNYVYHTAGIVSYNKLDNEKMYSVHINGTKNILDAAKELKVKKVVVTASTAGIGIPEDKNKPLNEKSKFDFKRYKKVMYMYSKHLEIEECKKYTKKGVNVCIVSPTTIIGAGDIFMNLGAVIKKIKEGKMKFAPPGGNSFVTIKDIVDAHILVMKKGKSGENYIFSDETITYLELFNMTAKLVNVKPTKLVLPESVLPIVKGGIATVENTFALFKKKIPLSAAATNYIFKFRYFDSSKARKQLKWKPKVTLKKALEEAIDFYEEQGLM